MEIGWPDKAYLAFKHYAVAAGLGEFGLNILLLTPQFGPRQRLSILVTNVPLIPHPLFTGKLCDLDDCGYKCVKICPAQAFNQERGVFVEIGYRTFTYASFNELKYSWVISGLYNGTFKFAPLDIDVPENLTPDELIIRKKMIQRLTPAYKKYKTFAFTVSTFCSCCLIACCEYLEEICKIKIYLRVKNNSFR